MAALILLDISDGFPARLNPYADLFRRRSKSLIFGKPSGCIRTAVLRPAVACRLVLFRAEVARTTVDMPVSKSVSGQVDEFLLRSSEKLTTMTESTVRY